MAAPGSSSSAALPLDERKKALERRFVENRPPLAYAKLSGRVGDDEPFEMLITHLPVELGRGPVATAPGPRIALGEQKAISRQHARIAWNQQKSCFELACLGKNGLFAAGRFIAKDKSVDLVSKMPIKIGPARLYFLAAIRSTCSTMSGFKLVQRAFDKARAASGRQALTVEEIVQQIYDLYPRSDGELGGRENLRQFVESYVVEDTQSFERVGTSEPPRYALKVTAIPIAVAVATTSSATGSTSVLGKKSSTSEGKGAEGAQKKAKVAVLA